MAARALLSFSPLLDPSPVLRVWHARPVVSGKETALLLPLIAGLLAVALARVVPVEPVVTVIDLVILLALGAALPDKPWRTAAISGVPGLVVLLARLHDRSAATIALTLALLPLAFLFTGILVKAGAALAERPARRVTEGRRRKPFETRAQRGRFLLVLLVVVLLGGRWLHDWGREEVDRDAARRADEVRRALTNRTPLSLQVAVLGGPDSLQSIPGGPYRSASPGATRFDATIELHRRLQYRCIHVHVDQEGRVATTIDDDSCTS